METTVSHKTHPIRRHPTISSGKQLQENEGSTSPSSHKMIDSCSLKKSPRTVMHSTAVGWFLSVPSKDSPHEMGEEMGGGGGGGSSKSRNAIATDRGSGRGEGQGVCVCFWLPRWIPWHAPLTRSWAPALQQIQMAGTTTRDLSWTPSSWAAAYI